MVSGRTVRSILEPADSIAVAAAALTPDQYARIKPFMHDGRAAAHRARGERGGQQKSRLARLDGYARTLMASYRSSWQRHSEFLPYGRVEEGDGSGPTANGADGTSSTGRGARFYTAREAARIMGFPDSFVVPGHPTREHGSMAYDAYTRFYHQIGNAVCPPVVKAIAKPILEALRHDGTTGKPSLT